MFNSINLDLSKVSVGSNNLLPNGVYQTKVTQASQKTSKRGNDMLEIVFEIDDGKGLKIDIIEYFVFTSGYALKRLKDMLIAAKFPTPDSVSSTEQLIGLKLQVDLAQRMEDFRLKSRIVQFLPLPDSNIPPAEDIINQFRL